MRLRLGLCVVATGAVACLSDPGSGGGGDDDASQIDAAAGAIDAPTGGGPDARVGPDATPGPGCPTGEPAFPGGTTIDLRHPLVANVNGDELDDLVLADLLTERVYFLFGRDCAFGTVADASHLVDDTGPMAVQLAELGGSEGAADLIVLGTSAATGQLAIYRGLGNGAFTDGALIVNVSADLDATTFVPQAGERSFVEVGNLDGDALPDLVLGHGTGVFRAELPASLDTLTQPGFEGMDLVPFAVPDEYTKVGTWVGDPDPLLFPSTAGGGVDDLVVSTDPFVFHYTNSGAGVLTRESTASFGSNQFVDFFDLVGADGVPEVFGVQSGSAAVTRFFPSAAAGTFRMVLSGGISSVDGIAVANVDGNPAPEVVALDNKGPGAPSIMVLYRNIALPMTGDTIDSGTPIPFEFPAGFHPDYIAFGNFAGDSTPELAAIDADVGVKCYRLSPSIGECPSE